MNVTLAESVLDPAAPAARAERFHALDALRAIAMLLGIYLHAAVPYMQFRPPFWPAHLADADQSLFHDVAIFVIHAFRMELFFLLAGFFAHLLIRRKGMKEFARHRAVRIGIPFVVGWGLMIVLLPISIGWKPFSDPRFLLPAHLWFLYYLIVFCVIALLMETIRSRSASSKGPPVDGVFSSIMRSPLHPLALGVVTLPFLLAMKTPVVDTPMAFHPVPRVAAYYGVFFAVGWFIHRQSPVLDSIRRWRWLALGGALLLTVPVLVLVEMAVGESGGLEVGPMTRKLFLLRAAYAVYTWLLVLGVMGLFLRHFSGESRAMRYLADSAYWQYIMHLPLVLFLQWKLAPLAIPGPIKLVSILAITVSVLLLTYHFFVRHTIIGYVLNGSRK